MTGVPQLQPIEHRANTAPTLTMCVSAVTGQNVA